LANAACVWLLLKSHGSVIAVTSGAVPFVESVRTLCCLTLAPAAVAVAPRHTIAPAAAIDRTLTPIAGQR
jgi:hypothetical protein